MLKFEITIDDQQWPLVTITASRMTYGRGSVMLQAKQQYDLAYGKVEEIAHNQLRPMVEELCQRHQRNQATRVGV